MVTNKTILELAKTCGFDEFVGEKDDETDGVYYQFWEEQLIEFALKIHEMGYNEGYDEGWESRAQSEHMNSSYPTGLVGDPQ